ncbi:MAG TPA: hypothetical protein VF755_00950, partial [Catenuloplanes sp.]
GAVVDLDDGSARWLAEREYVDLVDPDPNPPRRKRRQRATPPDPVTHSEASGVGDDPPADPSTTGTS